MRPRAVEIHEEQHGNNQQHITQGRFELDDGLDFITDAESLYYRNTDRRRCGRQDGREQQCVERGHLHDVQGEAEYEQQAHGKDTHGKDSSLRGLSHHRHDVQFQTAFEENDDQRHRAEVWCDVEQGIRGDPAGDRTKKHADTHQKQDARNLGQLEQEVRQEADENDAANDGEKNGYVHGGALIIFLRQIYIAMLPNETAGGRFSAIGFERVNGVGSNNSLTAVSVRKFVPVIAVLCCL